MKNLHLTLFFLTFFTTISIAATQSIYIIKDPIPPGPGPRTLTLIPVKANFDEINLNVCFDSNVGEVNIAVYDENENLIVNEFFNTSTTLEFSTDISDYPSGTYKLYITIGINHYKGYFTL